MHSHEHPEADAKKVLEQYVQHCSTLKMEPLASVKRFLKTVAKAPFELVIHGNDKYNFHERITDHHLEPLLHAITPCTPCMTKIDLRYNLLTDAGIKILSEFLSHGKEVEYINLKGNSIGSAGAEQLAAALKGSDKLTYLSLNGNSIGTDGCIAITELIFSNPKLKHLDIGNNDIKYDGIIALANVIGSNYTIETLNMENPSFLFFAVGQEWATHIGKMLANSIGLQKLSLRKYKLRCDGIYTIMEHLMENNKLRVLDLSANEISVEGCSAVAKFLKQEGCVLEGLALANNKAGDLGAKAISQALAVNKSLCYLDFTYNQIKDDGLSRLAESLEVNEKLQVVKLYGHNFFGQEAMGLFFKLQDKKPKSWIDFTVYVVDDHYDMGYADHGVNHAWTLYDP